MDDKKRYDNLILNSSFGIRIGIGPCGRYESKIDTTLI